MQDNIKVSGVFTLKCYRADGTLKWELKTPNTIMSAGKAALANLAGNVSSPTAFTYLAVGTSTTAVAVNQTALGAEITTGGLARASATVSRVTTTVTNGLKFEISREGDYFTTSDTTQKPGFRGTLHDLLPTYMVLEYAEENTISNVNLLERRAQKLEQALDLAYSKVAPDERNIISPKRILYK